MKTKILIILMFLVGISIFLYPTASNYLAERNQAEIIQNYSDEVSKMEQAEIDKELVRAEAYNKSLEETIIIDPFTEDISEEMNADYLDILNVNGTMGYIRIPKIDVDLPIYHGTSPEVLQKGVGHIQNTSLPVGGENTHAVLSGHRGLPSAKLFSDLDEIEIGDEFYIEVLGKVMLYTVDQIKVVKPDQTDDLQIVKGEDYVTLVTCTPYSVNTHRLLVRGTRTELTEVQEKEIQKKTEKRSTSYWLPVIIAAVFLLAFVVAGMAVHRKNRRKKRKGGKRH